MNSFLIVNSKSICKEENLSAIKKLKCICRKVFITYRAIMASSSSKVKKGSKMLVRRVEWKEPNFKLVPTIAKTLDPSGAQSQILPKVLLINDIRTHFKCSIQEIGTLEMDVSLGELCVNGVIKPKHRYLEDKGFTHITHLP